MGLLEDKRRARIFYRYLSMIYDRINPFIWNESMRAEALDIVGVESSDRVLDVGCGTGFGTEGLLQYVDHVTGIDQSPHQLQHARDKFPPETATLMLGDAERLPFEDDAFDVVWSSGSIEYWPHPVETLSDLRRVCRPGGRVLVVGPNQPRSRVMRAVADRIMLFYDPDEADRLFESAGFVDIEHHLMGPDYKPDIAITTFARVPE